MEAYRFVPYARAEKPDDDTTRLLEKAIRGESLNRQEKDRIGEILYGLFGSHGPTYKLAGWAWNMASCLPRILVQYKYDRCFWPHYAPDKTALRKALILPIEQMVYA